LAGAGGIEPCNNPLLHKDFSIPARPLDSIFDSKAKALVGMTDDEVAYIEAQEPSFPIGGQPNSRGRARLSAVYHANDF
jgi:hypothetical protein